MVILAFHSEIVMSAYLLFTVCCCMFLRRTESVGLKVLTVWTANRRSAEWQPRQSSQLLNLLSMGTTCHTSLLLFTADCYFSQQQSVDPDLLTAAPCDDQMAANMAAICHLTMQTSKTIKFVARISSVKCGNKDTNVIQFFSSSSTLFWQQKKCSAVHLLCLFAQLQQRKKGNSANWFGKL